MESLPLCISKILCSPGLQVKAPFRVGVLFPHFKHVLLKKWCQFSYWYLKTYTQYQKLPAICLVVSFFPMFRIPPFRWLKEKRKTPKKSSWYLSISIGIFFHFVEECHGVRPPSMSRQYIWIPPYENTWIYMSCCLLYQWLKEVIDRAFLVNTEMIEYIRQ